MEIIQYNLEDSFSLPENFLKMYGDLPFALFDIETTGLNSSFNKVILIGILYYNNGNLMLEQLFCHSKDDEPYILEKFVERTKEIPLLISYNGDSFDIPFLSKRIEVIKTLDKLPNFCSLDLLKFVRAFKSEFNLESCKLKAIEQYLGIEREDQISGKESVNLYNKYLTNKDPQLKDLILLHNHDDLRYLLQVMSILDSVSHEKMLSAVPYIYDFLNGLWVINKTSIKGNSLMASGKLLYDEVNDHIIHRPGYSFEYTNNTFYLKIPLYKEVLDSGEKCLYININEYPIDYNSLTQIDLIPDNIIILKKDKNLNYLDIYGFLKKLLPIIAENLLETSI